MNTSKSIWIASGVILLIGAMAYAGTGVPSGQFKVQDVRILNQPIQTSEKVWTVRIYQAAWTFVPLTRSLPEKPKVDDLIEIDRQDGGSVWNMTLAKVLEVGPINESKEVRVLVTFQSATFGKP